MNERGAIISSIGKFAKELEAVPGTAGHGSIPCDLNVFILLLGGISSYRKIPGVDGHMGFSKLYVCKSEEARLSVRKHLKDMYGIVDETSLHEACKGFYSTGEDYDQFLSFWSGEPVFDENELGETVRRAFRANREYAAQLRRFVEDRGFYAWDCNERVGLLRAAYACGIISEAAFWKHGKMLARLAVNTCSSWEEYALGCICGALYFMFRQSGGDERSLGEFCEMTLQVARTLFFRNPVWTRSQWFSFPPKALALAPEQIKTLLTDWDGPDACIATDRIVADGCRVGYMYREKPGVGMPDSGWRFFAGDEDEEYIGDPDNCGFYSLNTLCNYDPDIIPLLREACGTAFARDGNGELRPVGGSESGEGER